MKKYKRAITYGTYDLFHVGHVRLLKRIAEMADELYVVVSSDEFNKIKGKTCVIPFEERREIIESLACVTKVLREDNWDQKIQDIIDNQCDVFVMGNDWITRFDYLNKYCDVVYLPRTPGVSSSSIKEKLKQNKI